MHNGTEVRRSDVLCHSPHVVIDRASASSWTMAQDVGPPDRPRTSPHCIGNAACTTGQRS
eukprot:19042-Eustigmatos_ZCMA.PRE.1